MVVPALLSSDVKGPRRVEVSAHMTIGRRLSILVLSELFTAVIVVVTATVSLNSLVEKNRYLRDFVFPSLAEIGEAFDVSSGFVDMIAAPWTGTCRRAPARRSKRFARLLDRYQRLWQIEDSPSRMRYASGADLARRTSSSS